MSIRSNVPYAMGNNPPPNGFTDRVQKEGIVGKIVFNNQPPGTYLGSVDIDGDCFNHIIHNVMSGTIDCYFSGNTNGIVPDLQFNPENNPKFVEFPNVREKKISFKVNSNSANNGTGVIYFAFKH